MCSAFIDDCFSDCFSITRSADPGRYCNSHIYKPYKHVPPQRVGFLGLFSLKMGIDSAHFDLESGMVFEGTTGLYDRIYCFNSK